MGFQIDKLKIEAAFREVLLAIGEDPEREGLQGTPARMARMYEELFGGLHEDPAALLTVSFNEYHDEMIVLKDIPFYSTCEHHLVPFFGRAHVAYIPMDGKVVGVSKLARVVDVYARRPQLQERLTSQIADCLFDTLKPRGVAVIMEAEHLCMAMRGVQKPGAKMVTSAIRGGFETVAKTRNELFALIANG
ncbi:MAG: GTP cyclohydrolase I FolE [Syntrophomonadaceae bacterium]|nr:GTP cyclohydrolase I FolE [Syntrophomonadaceae bacterium]